VKKAVSVITTFTDRQREKQIKYEKTVLKDISIKSLKESVKQHFGSIRFTSGLLLNTGVEEACYDVAIEAYLLGAHFSRFGYYGEGVEQVLERCRSEEKHFVDTLYNFLLYWGSGEEAAANESLAGTCEHYVRHWWMEGFQKGQRRYKLRLH
jgi:Protein of unknown function (DUF2521)